ncbi:MAG: hypothetical protein KUG77_17455 [Nannocystaceae bacterium]|nr:hypothetical protein [Nannocystaceae bacterium]
MKPTQTKTLLVVAIAALSGCYEGGSGPKTRTAQLGRVYDLGELPAHAQQRPVPTTELRPWAEIQAEVADQLADAAVRTNAAPDIDGSLFLDQLTAESIGVAASFVPTEGTFGPVENLGGLYTCISSEFGDSGEVVDTGVWPTISVVNDTEFVVTTLVPSEAADFLLPPALNEDVWFEEHCTLGGLGNRFFQCTEVDSRLDIRPIYDFVTGQVQQRSGVFIDADTAYTVNRVIYSCEGTECNDPLVESIAFKDNMPCTDRLFERIDIQAD